MQRKCRRSAELREVACVAMPAPSNPKVYHITHLNNLPKIISSGRLYSDAAIVRQVGVHAKVGMGKLKAARFERPVTCHGGTFVSDYVPFYFCSRSVMLYILSRGNHDEVEYKGGQDPILHLEADFHSVIDAADAKGVPWAVSLSNAASRYATFRTGPAALDELDWECIGATQWSRPDVREHKQAEFLVHRSFPWARVDRLGVRNATVHQQVRTHLLKAEHQPPVEVQPAWYY